MDTPSSNKIWSLTWKGRTKQKQTLVHTSFETTASRFKYVKAAWPITLTHRTYKHTRIQTLLPQRENAISFQSISIVQILTSIVSKPTCPSDATSKNVSYGAYRILIFLCWTIHPVNIDRKLYSSCRFSDTDRQNVILHCRSMIPDQRNGIG